MPKPEYMTHLKGSLLVSKNHPRIHFRGALDKLVAFIISAQIIAQEEGKVEFTCWLGEMLNLCDAIFLAEIQESVLLSPVLFGLDADKLRRHSHHPEKYYGLNHFKPDFYQGRLMCALNLVRVISRETELKALQAFFNTNNTVAREDIILSLNRLSSASYILMCRLASSVKVK